MNAINKSTFSTKQLPSDARFATWQESISTIFDVAPTLRTPTDRFNASLTSYLLNDQIMLTHCETVAQKFERGPHRPAVDGLDHYLIQTHLRGGQEVESGQRHGEAGVGDILVIDLAEHHMATTSDYEHLTLVIPRPLLAPFLDNPDSQEARVLKAGHPLTDAAVGHLKLLTGMADSLTHDDATLLTQPTLALMASALNGTTDSVEGGAAAATASLILRAKALIEGNLQQNDFSVARLCSGLGISRASLYRLFEPHGGVRAYVQERRLRRAAQDLMSPNEAHRYIYDIAFNWGFVSEAHFSRAFKTRFGLSPKQARDMSKAGLQPNIIAPNMIQAGDRDYETWLSKTLRY